MKIIIAQGVDGYWRWYGLGEGPEFLPTSPRFDSSVDAAAALDALVNAFRGEISVQEEAGDGAIEIAAYQSEGFHG